jgi:hypothetical protein
MFDYFFFGVKSGSNNYLEGLVILDLMKSLLMFLNKAIYANPEALLVIFSAPLASSKETLH